MTRSIAELRAQDVTFQPDEAVAIAQQLITACRGPQDADEVQPPYGPPSIANVFVNDDGSVVCRGSTTAPAVSEVGIFLEALLPEGSSRVPGGLRFTIARALLNVDVPPFDSLDAFSRDLARHEHGGRADVVRGLLARSAGCAAVPLPLVNRRTRPVSSMRAAAAGVAAGLALIGAGEFMHARRVPAAATPSAPVAAHTVVPDSARVQPARGTIVVRAIVPPSKVEGSRPPRPARRVVSLKRPRRLDTAQGKPFARKPAPRGVLDRLKLGWLRRAFTVHSDL